jgi:hypothetical protein
MANKGWSLEFLKRAIGFQAGTPVLSRDILLLRKSVKLLLPGLHFIPNKILPVGVALQRPLSVSNTSAIGSRWMRESDRPGLRGAAALFSTLQHVTATSGKTIS